MKRSARVTIDTGAVGLIVLLFQLSVPVSSQPNYPRNLFRSPVDGELSLSGTYGEVRANHFHSGIDIRTDAQVGKPVYAAADGYVSRIYVSPWGFGKALYLYHPSGYTTVYGHLDRFRGEIASYALEQHYANESFALDVAVPAGLLQVRKGEVIGYSGNSGSSAGPHLHFEIRDARTQEPLDPIAFGIPVQDNLSPQVRWVKIYPHGGTGMVNQTTRPVALHALGDHGHYRLDARDTVRISGTVIFGIEVYDYHNNSSIRCGIKSVELFVDGVKVFGQSLERYAFSETRYVNAILDFQQNQRNKQRFLRSYVAPGNRLEVFEGVVNRGVVNFTDRSPHRIQYVVADASGNSSRVDFWVVSDPPIPNPLPAKEAKTAGALFAWDRENRFATDYLSFVAPAGALYEDVEISYRSSPPVKGMFARLHRLHTDETPLHLFCELSIRAETLPRQLETKALLVRVEKSGKFVSQGGTFQNGYVAGRIREFGDYTIAADTLPPKVNPLNIYPGKNISKQNTIAFTISDDLAGISGYRGRLNGNWILMDWDPKSNRLVYRYDDRIKPGRNTFELTVTDGVGNRTEYTAILTR